jgi:hypothetical protein
VIRNNRSPLAGAGAAELPADVPARCLFSAWTGFWFTPISPVGLHWIRLLSGLVFLCWLLPFAGHQSELFSLDGLFDLQAYREAAGFPPPGPPVPIGWSLLYLCGDNAVLLHAVYWGAVATFLLFTLGVATRVTSVLTWVFVISFVANPATHFDADFLLVIMAFYLMIGYLLLGQFSGEPTPLGRLLGTRETFVSPWKSEQPVSYAANLTVRLFQVHFAVIMVTSGLSKLQIGDWWSGVAFWYWLYPPYSMSAERLGAVAPNAEVLLFGLTLAQYLTLAWLIAFPAFAWRPRCRWLVLSGGVLAWLGSIFIFGQPLFGPVYLIGCLSFLSAGQWQAITDWTRGLVKGWTGGVKVQSPRKVSVRG